MMALKILFNLPQYDQEALVATLQTHGKTKTPEFVPPVNKFYIHADGEFTPYGHELHGLLKALAETGKVESTTLASSLQSYYQHQADLNHYLNKSSKSIKETGKPLAGDAQVSDQKC